MIKINIKKRLNTADGKIVLELNKEIQNSDFLTLFIYAVNKVRGEL